MITEWIRGNLFKNTESSNKRTDEIEIDEDLHEIGELLKDSSSKEPKGKSYEEYRN